MATTLYVGTAGSDDPTRGGTAIQFRVGCGRSRSPANDLAWPDLPGFFGPVITGERRTSDAP